MSIWLERVLAARKSASRACRRVIVICHRKKCCAAETSSAASSPATSFFSMTALLEAGLLTAVQIASLVSMHGKIERRSRRRLEGLSANLIHCESSLEAPLDRCRKSSRALAEAQSALGENGRVVLRYSGTEQLARVWLKRNMTPTFQRYSQSLANALRSSIGA